MNTDLEPAFEHDPLSEAVIGCVFRVAKGPGTGFPEKVCGNALMHDLWKAGLKAAQRVLATVHHHGQNGSDDLGDILVEGRLLLELEASKALEDSHLARYLNDLKATRRATCRPQFRYRQTTHSAGVTMGNRDLWPPNCSATEKNSRAGEPPTNTDEHRSTADEQKESISRTALVCIKPLPVFLGVSRWSTTLFNRLDRASSVASLGACDAFVA
jgi:GxxExxY protein